MSYQPISGPINPFSPFISWRRRPGAPATGVTGTASFTATAATDPVTQRQLISFDNATDSGAVFGTTVTWSHNCSSLVGGVFIVCILSDAQQFWPTVTYGGVSMTRSNFTPTVGGGGLYSFYLIAPLSGANNAVVTMPGSASNIRAQGASYTGSIAAIDNGGGSGPSAATVSGQDVSPGGVRFHSLSWSVGWFYAGADSIIQPRQFTYTDASNSLVQVNEFLRVSQGGLTLIDAGPLQSLNGGGYPSAPRAFSNQPTTGYSIIFTSLAPLVTYTSSPGCFGQVSSPVNVTRLIGWQHLRNRFKVLQSFSASGTVSNPPSGSVAVATTASLAAAGSVFAPSSGSSGLTATASLAASGIVSAPGGAASVTATASLGGSGTVAAPIAAVTGSAAFHDSVAFVANGVQLTVPPPPSGQIRVTTAPRRT